ncbi:MAG: YggU family protein [Desulfobacterales bacterium]|nr:YggU family protein [Desulfobacterales bacterium]
MTVLYINVKDKELHLKIFVQPKSSKNSIVGIHGDALKIKIAAPPVDNEANKSCIEFLSKILKMPKSSMDIISGHTSRTKMLSIKFNDANETKIIKEKILKLI